MRSKRWKTYELKAARFFGTKRTPLSGINSGHDTHSDTLHKRLYVEVKSAQANKGSNAYVWRAVHGLAPGVWRLGGGSALYFVHSSLIEKPGWALGSTIALSGKIFDLWCDTSGKAIDENKLPLLALFTKGSRGFWLAGRIDSLIAAAREHALTEVRT